MTRSAVVVRSAAIILAAACTRCTGGDNPLPHDRADLDALPRLMLQEEARIGSVDDPDYGFSRVGDVAVDPEGNVYVFESQDRQIRVYAPDGRLRHRIGRSGQGPGEFSGSVILGVTHDTLWTVESFRRRLTLFHRTGELIRAVMFDEVNIPRLVTSG